MLNPNEKSALRVIQSTPQWSVVLRLKDELIKKINSNSLVGDSEWDTLKAVLERDGKIKGIEQFFQEVVNHSNEK